MSENKIMKAYRLKPSTIEQIKLLKEEIGLPSFESTIDYVFNDYATNRNKEFINSILEAFDEKYGNLFTRIRLGVNGADQNTQVLVELMNTLIYVNKISNFFPTEDLETVPLQLARKTVKERIERFRIKKLEKQQNS